MPFSLCSASAPYQVSPESLGASTPGDEWTFLLEVRWRRVDNLDKSSKIAEALSVKTVVHSNQNIVYNCHYHVVFCPKYRRKVLVKGIDERLKVLLLECIEKWRQELVELEVMPDHVHLLVGCDPQFGIHRLVKYLKGSTSHQLRQEYPELKQK